jgi:Icc-related predicted phosphoesterase
MKIKLVSDAHLEFSNLVIPNDKDYDVLILSGDIMIAEYLHDFPAPDPYEYGAMEKYSHRMDAADRFRTFLKQVSSDFPKVVYVAGNHELYGGKFYAGIEYLYEECRQYPNIFFLEKDYTIIDNIAFIGGTLWTDCNKMDHMTMYMFKHDRSGYRKIRPEDTVTRHNETLNYFKKTIKELKDNGVEKFVMVTHHSPSHLSIHPRYATDHEMNGGYHSDLSEFILDNPEIILFTHGHTHSPFDYMIGGTRVVCNPRGYENERYNENTGWDPNILLEI